MGFLKRLKSSNGVEQYPASSYTSATPASSSTPKSLAQALPSPASSHFPAESIHSHTFPRSSQPPQIDSPPASVHSKAGARPGWKRLFRPDGKPKERDARASRSGDRPEDIQSSSIRSRRGLKGTLTPLVSNGTLPELSKVLSRQSIANASSTNLADTPRQSQTARHQNKSKPTDFAPETPPQLPPKTPVDETVKPKKRDSLYKDYVRSVTPVEDRGIVMVSKEDGQGEIGENGMGRASEEMEVLESAEKKQKFWVNKRLRRPSKAATDAAEELEVGLRLPRFSRARADPSLNHPRRCRHHSLVTLKISDQPAASLSTWANWHRTGRKAGRRISGVHLPSSTISPSAGLRRVRRSPWAMSMVMMDRSS